MKLKRGTIAAWGGKYISKGSKMVGIDEVLHHHTPLNRRLHKKQRPFRIPENILSREDFTLSRASGMYIQLNYLSYKGKSVTSLPNREFQKVVKLLKKLTLKRDKGIKRERETRERAMCKMLLIKDKANYRSYSRKPAAYIHRLRELKPIDTLVFDIQYNRINILDLPHTLKLDLPVGEGE